MINELLSLLGAAYFGCTVVLRAWRPLAWDGDLVKGKEKKGGMLRASRRRERSTWRGGQRSHTPEHPGRRMGWERRDVVGKISQSLSRWEVKICAGIWQHRGRIWWGRVLNMWVGNKAPLVSDELPKAVQSEVFQPWSQ